MHRTLARLCIVIALALACRSAYAEQVVLTNGTVIVGEVTEDGDTIVVKARGATPVASANKRSSCRSERLALFETARTEAPRLSAATA